MVRDELVTVETRHRYLPRYTVQELVRLGELGRGAKMSEETLRNVHLVKRLGGTVVQ